MLVVLSAAAGDPQETQSGIQRYAPKIYGRLEEGDAPGETAYLVIHPTSNFFNHYLVDPLAKRGRSILALNTRYIGNDSMLLMERAIQDLGAGMKYLRERGFRRIVLIGNSGGGPLAAMYQAEAESPAITALPDGKPIAFRREDMPPADALILLGAHTSRADVLAARMDPALLDEADANRLDPALDMFDRRNGPPYDRTWLARYRAAQKARMDRLSDWVERSLKSTPGDMAFIVHRTNADPRFLDLTIDPSDRKAESSAGNALTANVGPNGLARFSTLRSFLSQWSPRHTRGDGPACLARTTVPILNVYFRGDQGIYPSDAGRYTHAAAGRCEQIDLPNVPHYPQTVPGLVETIADRVVAWGG